jgi:hypothetical protein
LRWKRGNKGWEKQKKQGNKKKRGTKGRIKKGVKKMANIKETRKRGEGVRDKRDRGRGRGSKRDLVFC